MFSLSFDGIVHFLQAGEPGANMNIRIWDEMLLRTAESTTQEWQDMEAAV